MGRRGDRAGGKERPRRTLPDLGSPTRPPRRPQSWDPRGEARSKRSLGYPVRPLPCFPKMLINLAISCPMARPRPGGSRTRPRRPRLSPGTWSPAPGGGPAEVYEVTEASGVSCGAWEFPGTLTPGGEGAMDVTMTTNCLSRALEVQGKWDSDSILSLTLRKLQSSLGELLPHCESRRLSTDSQDQIPALPSPSAMSGA